MKYLRGRNAIEDLVYEIPTSQYVADMLPDVERGYALAVRRAGGVWMITYAGSIQSAMKTYRAQKRMSMQFPDLAGEWSGYSDGIVYGANLTMHPHRHTEWYAAGVIVDDEREECEA